MKQLQKLYLIRPPETSMLIESIKNSLSQLKRPKTPLLRIAVLTCYKSKQYITSDPLLINAFEKQGLSHEEVVWDTPGVNWQDYSAVIIRSTWDYIETGKREQFLQTLTTITQLGIPLYNSLATVQWNSKKTYLKELQKNGVSIISTIIITQKKSPLIQPILEQLGGSEWVIKPVISAGAYKTFRINLQTAQEIYQLNYDLDEEILVQPFITEVVTQGELSFIFFNKIFSHATNKRSAPGDFRVQDIHGGTTHTFHPKPWMIQEAQRVLNIAQQLIGELHPLLYARVDVILRNNALFVMELELIEPTLFLNHQDGSADTFTSALKTTLHKDLPC